VVLYWTGHWSRAPAQSEGSASRRRLADRHAPAPDRHAGGLRGTPVYLQRRCSSEVDLSRPSVRAHASDSGVSGMRLHLQGQLLAWRMGLRRWSIGTLQEFHQSIASTIRRRSPMWHIYSASTVESCSSSMVPSAESMVSVSSSVSCQHLHECSRRRPSQWDRHQGSRCHHPVRCRHFQGHQPRADLRVDHEEMRRRPSKEGLRASPSCTRSWSASPSS